LLHRVEPRLYHLSVITTLMQHAILSNRRLELEVCRLRSDTFRDSLSRLKASRMDNEVRGVSLDHTDALFEWDAPLSKRNVALDILLRKLCEADAQRILSHLQVAATKDHNIGRSTDCRPVSG
jgi:hypothetical protein